MRPRFSALLLSAVGFLTILASRAPAQVDVAPRLRSYEFLRQLSVLKVTGAEGPQGDFNVVGTFDFLTTPSLVAIYPPMISAEFVNVQAAGMRGFQNFAIPLEEAFNLTDLDGFGRGGRPLHVFRFLGSTDFGASVDLWAATLGPWFYMRGATTAPPNVDDFPEYSIKALAHERPFADFNDDGSVDRADLARWLAAPGFYGADFLNWQQQFGDAPPADADFEAAIAAASQNAAPAPEPGSLALATISVVSLAARARRHI